MGDKTRSLLRIASIVAFLVVVSKAFGFLREVVVAEAFGKGIERDAYNLAYQLPAYALVLLGGLNGPFHTATQSALTRLKEAGREDRGGVILTLTALTGVVMGAIALTVYFLADPIVRIQGPWVSSETHSLAVNLLRVMAPIILIGAWVGVLCGISTDQGRYSLASLSPMVSSLAIIAAILWRPNDPLMLAVGTMAGAFLQLALQGIPALKFTRIPKFAPLSDPVLKDAGRLLWPAILSSSIGQVNVIIGTIFLSRAGDGAISAWAYANVIFQLPLGTLLAALLVPLFPRLTAAAARDDRPELLGLMNRGISIVALLAVPLAAGIALTATPLVRAAFERGKFAATNGTEPTALVLSILALGLVAYAARDLLVRVFYATNDSATPLRVSIVSLFLNVALNAFFMFGLHWGLGGIALSTAIVTWLNLAQVAWALRRKLGSLDFRASWPTIIRASGATAGAAVIGHLLVRLSWPGGTLGALAELLVVGGAFGAAYAGLLLAFGQRFSGRR